MAHIPPAPTRASVRKAASRIRKWSRGEHVDQDVLGAALDTVDLYRAQFSVPTSRVAMGLRSMVNTLRLDAEVTQRIKRHVTIIDKITDRETTLDLSKMQDIGGCRVITGDRESLHQLHKRIKSVWGDAIDHEADYIQSPRDSGYRAIHVVVMREGYPIEIQLRDHILHAWAETVEAISALTRRNYKHDGDSIVQRFMLLESGVNQSMEAGHTLPPDLVDEMDILRNQVWHYVNDAAPPQDGEN